MNKTTKETNDYFAGVGTAPEVKEGIMTFGDHLDMEREEGRAEGKRMSIITILKCLGNVPATINDRLNEINDEAELDRLLIVAAKAASMQEFEKELG